MMLDPSQPAVGCTSSVDVSCAGCIDGSSILKSIRSVSEGWDG